MEIFGNLWKFSCMPIDSKKNLVTFALNSCSAARGETFIRIRIITSSLALLYCRFPSRGKRTDGDSFMPLLPNESLCRELVTSEEVATHIGINAVRGKHNNRNVGRDYQALCWRDLPLIDRAFNSNRYEGAQRGRRRGERQVAQKPERDQIALGAFASLQTTTWVKASRG